MVGQPSWFCDSPFKEIGRVCVKHTFETESPALPRKHSLREQNPTWARLLHPQAPKILLWLCETGFCLSLLTYPLELNCFNEFKFPISLLSASYHSCFGTLTRQTLKVKHLSRPSWHHIARWGNWEGILSDIANPDILKSGARPDRREKTAESPLLFAWCRRIETKGKVRRCQSL